MGDNHGTTGPLIPLGDIPALLGPIVKNEVHEALQPMNERMDDLAGSIRIAEDLYRNLQDNKEIKASLGQILANQQAAAISQSEIRSELRQLQAERKKDRCLLEEHAKKIDLLELRTSTTGRILTWAGKNAWGLIAASFTLGGIGALLAGAWAAIIKACGG